MTTKSSRIIWLAGVLALVFIAIVLRPAVAAVGPLLHEISDSLPLNPTETSILASAPVFCFGLGATNLGQHGSYGGEKEVGVTRIADAG